MTGFLEPFVIAFLIAFVVSAGWLAIAALYRIAGSLERIARELERRRGPWEGGS